MVWDGDRDRWWLFLLNYPKIYNISVIWSSHGDNMDPYFHHKCKTKASAINQCCSAAWKYLGIWILCTQLWRLSALTCGVIPCYFYVLLSWCTCSPRGVAMAYVHRSFSLGFPKEEKCAPSPPPHPVFLFMQAEIMVCVHHHTSHVPYMHLVQNWYELRYYKILKKISV